MKAVILCAGDGTRLMPLTAMTPKPLVPFLDKTILEYVLASLPKTIDEVYLVIRESTAQHFDLFLRTHNFPFSLYTAIQPHNTKGTFDALLSVSAFIQPDENFLVINGDDIFSTQDLELLSASAAPACGLYKTIRDRKYRTCDIDDLNQVVTRFRDQTEEEIGKPVTTFTGAYLLGGEFFSREVVTYMDESSIPDTLFAHYNQVHVVPFSSWYPINTLEEYHEAKTKIGNTGYSLNA